MHRCTWTERIEQTGYNGIDVQSITQPSLPLFWILGTVKNRMNNNAMKLNFVEDRVGESASKYPSILRYRNRIHQGVLMNRFYRCFKTPQKFKTQPETLLLVPGEGFNNIRPGFRNKIDIFTLWGQESFFLPRTMVWLNPDSEGIFACGVPVRPFAIQEQVGRLHSSWRCCPISLQPTANAQIRTVDPDCLFQAS
jgi:hypothetical protein